MTENGELFVKYAEKFIEQKFSILHPYILSIRKEYVYEN